MLKVAGLNVAIGPVPIVRDASLALEEGQMCGLIGRNGAGKTTLMKTIMGLLPPRAVAINARASPVDERLATAILTFALRARPTSASRPSASRRFELTKMISAPRSDSRITPVMVSLPERRPMRRWPTSTLRSVSR